ncbi:unnamed protein product [Trypanosoma congolense IL3000]|uniref:WGS project CAEQ00000000 data, annotated contig 2070 n=1 Tax=Trypanosoma congolense (strain IL3000) TaxID=1068625 RepID=F9WB71_TRYCI|nr:unnamed protein product [Trypanosoma congolense IL3000]
MGKKATLQRTQQRHTRHTREQRERKSMASKAARRGDLTAAADRLVKRTAPPRATISQERKELLVAQFSQACRLPAACDDLCSLLLQGSSTEQAQAEGSRKRRRDSSEVDMNILDLVADAFLALEHEAATADEDEGAEPLTILEDVVQDECGSRVACALFAALATSGCDDRKKSMTFDVAMKLFEESEDLHEHYIACKVLSSLVLNGDHEIQRRALQVICQGAETLDLIQMKLRNRHTSVTIQHLIEQFPTETVAWLKDALGLSGTTATKKGSKKNRLNTQQSDALLSLIADPIAAPVMRALFLHDEDRTALLKGVDLTALLGTKRGCKFLREALTHNLEKLTSEEAVKILDLVVPVCEGNITEMCTSADANFVVQSLIALTPYAGEEGPTRLRQLLQLLGPQLPMLMGHPIAVHVVVSIVVTADSLPEKSIVEEAAAVLINRNNVSEMLCDPRGSLVLRKLLPRCRVKESVVGQLLTHTIGRDITNLIYDPIGNVIVQEYMKVCGGETFARKLLKGDELLSMCQHTYASHVVGSLFDNVGASTHTALCNALRPHVVPLTKHINGRFAVEKAIPASRDICDVLLRNFFSLACEKGSQHVLCTLMANLDSQGKSRVVDIVLANLMQLATQQSSSIVLQKLMQSDQTLAQRVKEKLAQDCNLRNNVAQNFYGKFVVQICDAT